MKWMNEMDDAWMNYLVCNLGRSPGQIIAWSTNQQIIPKSTNASIHSPMNPLGARPRASSGTAASPPPTAWRGRW